MAADVSKKPQQKVQKRDGLPKACSIDAWLTAHKTRDQRPLLGGIAWANETLCCLARIDGAVHALPFSQFTASNKFRDALSDEDKQAYDRLRKESFAKHKEWVARREKDSADGIGF
jgi:hypothetical protein